MNSIDAAEPAPRDAGDEATATAIHNHTVAALILEHRDLVRAVCRRVLGADSLVDDAVQETFLQALRTPAPAGDAMAGWLHRVAVNKCRDLLRRERAQHRRAERAAATGDPAADAPTRRGDDAPPHATLVHQLDEALLELPEPGRRLLTSHFLQGQSQCDLATALGVSQATISRRLQRAIDQLRSRLAQRGIDAAACHLAGTLAGCGPLAGYAGGTPAQAWLPRLGRSRIAKILGAAFFSGCILVILQAHAQVPASRGPDDIPRPRSTPAAAFAGSTTPLTTRVPLCFHDDDIGSASRALEDALPLGQTLPVAIREPWPPHALTFSWSCNPASSSTVEQACGAIASAFHGRWVDVHGRLVLTRLADAATIQQWQAALGRLQADAVLQDAPAEATAAAALIALQPAVALDPRVRQSLDRVLLCRQPLVAEEARRQLLQCFSPQGTYLAVGYTVEWSGARDAVVVDADLLQEVRGAIRRATTEARSGPGPHYADQQSALALAIASECRLQALLPELWAYLDATAPGFADSGSVSLAIDAIGLNGGPADALRLVQLLPAVPNGDSLCSCLLALARLGAAQTWQAAWAMRDDRRILAIHHPYVETILSSFPEAVARGQMLAVLASPQAPDDRISGAAQALGHWGHSADEALLLAPLGTHLIVSEQWSHALGRLATQGTLPQLAQALRRSARTASQREVDEITLGHGLASCPDDGFWQEVARCAATSADPIEVSLATRALADGHRPGQRDLLLRSLRERHGEPAVVTTLAHAAAQLPGHDAAAEVMQVLLDPGFPIADKRKIIAWITSQDLQLAVVSQARRLQSGPGHAHLVWGNLRSLDNVAAQQIAAAIARDGTEDAGDRGLALLFAQCLDEHQVIHLLADREPFVRECAILDLADNFQREPNALAALLDCLAHDPVAAVRAKAAQGLFNFEPDNDPACCQGEVQALSTDADVGTRIEAEKSMIGVIVNTFTPPAQRTLVLAALVAAQQRSQVPAELAAIRAVIAGKSDPITTQNPLAGYYDGSGLNYHYQHVITVPDPAAAPAGQPGPKSNG